MAVVVEMAAARGEVASSHPVAQAPAEAAETRAAPAAVMVARMARVAR